MVGARGYGGIVIFNIKIEGLGEFEKGLNDLKRRAEELEQTSSVSFAELFNESFMVENTEFSSLDELLKAGGFEVNSEEDFQNIPGDAFDDHIATCTRFENWKAMQDAALGAYVSKKLGF